jgi:type II secretory pathway component PulK
MTRPPNSQRGVAIIAVTTALVIIIAMLTEFGTNTTVDALSAANARDQMRAELLMRSGLNVAQLVIKIQTDAIDAHQQEISQLFGRKLQLGEYVGQFLGVLGGSKQEAQEAGAMLGITGDDLERLGSEGGTFDLAITSDDGRINMNCANGAVETQEALRTQLEALVFFDAYNPLFETPDASGWRRDRAQQVAALIDYVDRDNAKAGAPGTSEDYGYESLADRFLAKNNYVDTIGELKLARGVDDRFWTLFGPSFTIYGGCKVNVEETHDPKLIAALIFLSAKSPDDPVLRDSNMLFLLAKQVADARNIGMQFDELQTFADYAKNPMGAIGDLYATRGLPPPPGAEGGAGTQVVGVELDVTKLAKIARTGARRTYRVEVTTEVPRGAITEWTLRRSATAVWDTQTQNQNSRDPRSSRGAWVFYQEK